MIIETAFLRLPHLLTRNCDHGDIFESTVAQMFSVSVQTELDALGRQGLGRMEGPRPLPGTTSNLVGNFSRSGARHHTFLSSRGFLPAG